MPEADKLVALSRLFHPLVGMLLGAEEVAIAEPSRPAVPRWKRWLRSPPSTALGAVHVVLVLRVNILQSGQADRFLVATPADDQI